MSAPLETTIAGLDWEIFLDNFELFSGGRVIWIGPTDILNTVQLANPTYTCEFSIMGGDSSTVAFFVEVLA